MRNDINTYSIMICDLFEELLDRHDITIPDDDRQGLDNEGRIYGTTWGELNDKVTAILEELAEKAKYA